MINLAAALLGIVDHTTRRTGPVSHVIDRVADRMLPQTTANAGSCPPSGYHSCGYTCSSHWLCWIADPLLKMAYYYYDQSPTCTSREKCRVGCTYLCS